MSVNQTSTVTLLDRAYAVLLRELGPVDFVRVLQQMRPGHGDYTRDRSELVDRLTLDQIQKIIEANTKATP